MSKEKQTPCEEAWDELVNRGRDRKIEPGLVPMGCQEMFAAGFRAGEEGKKELLEALKSFIIAAQNIGGTHVTGWNELESEWLKAEAAIAKHTAK